MNREERRNNKPQLTEEEKIEKRLKAWVKTWNFEQKKLFEKMVTNEVNKIEDLTEQVLNECFGVAIHEMLEELTVEEINKILITANMYMEDYKKVIEESKGDYINMMKELEPVIKKEIKTMVKSGKDKLEGIKELRIKHKVPQNELVKMWLDVKENISKPNSHTPKKYKKEVTADKEEKKVTDELEETKEQADKELKETIKKHSPKEEKEICEKFSENMKKVFPSIKSEVKPQLIVLNTIQQIQGANGIYVRSVEGVKLGNKVYKDKSIVEEEKTATEGEYNSKISTIEEEIEKWNNKLKEVKEQGKKELEKYAELEEVFNL